MGKIGRNEKCPCGSGKKYKNCCLGKEEIVEEERSLIPVVDISSFLHIKIGALGLIHLNISFKTIYEEFCVFKSYDNYDIQLSDSFFKSFLNYIETKIIEICSQYPAYEIFYWYRRIKPTNIVPWFQNSTAYSYHELMKLCIFRFGNQIDNFVYMKDELTEIEGIHPEYIHKYFEDFSKLESEEPPLEVVKILNSIYQLEVYCSFYISLKNKWRIFSKGGEFFSNPEIGFSVYPKSEEINYLIELYDKRSKIKSLLTIVGTISEDIKPITNTQLLVVGLQQNFEKIELRLKNIKIYHDGSFNFIPYIIDLSDYYDFTKQFNEYYITKFGFTVEIFLSVIITYSRYLQGFIEEIKEDSTSTQSVIYITNLFQRGYDIISNYKEMMESQMNRITNTYNSIFSGIKKEKSYKPFQKAFEYLFFSASHYDDLEVELLRKSLFTQITKSKIIVDYTSFAGVLVSFLNPIKSLDGKLGNICSTSLEKVTNKFIEKEFGEEKKYITGKIRAQNEKEKEIDATLMVGEFLFIFECKSLNVSDESILGEKKSVEFRTKKIKDFLEEVDKKADFLKENKNGLTKRIPDAIKYIVPIVITSFPEYIWEASEDLFIKSDLPRVMVVQEIKELKNIAKFELLVGKPYLRIL